MGDIFGSKDFEKAGETGGSAFFLPGQYPEVELEEMKMVHSRQDDCDVFIAKFTINESQVPDRPKGSTAAFITKLDKDIETKLGGVKTLIAKCLNCAFADVTPDICRSAVSSEAPLKGTKLRLQARNIETKKKKLPFTVHDWTHKELSPTMKALAEAAAKAASAPA